MRENFISARRDANLIINFFGLIASESHNKLNLVEYCKNHTVGMIEIFILFRMRGKSLISPILIGGRWGGSRLGWSTCVFVIIFHP